MTTTTIDRAQVGRGFWLRWVLANLVGVSVGVAVGGPLLMSVASFTSFFGGTRAAIGGAMVCGVGGLIIGAVSGAAQWFVLRSHVAR